MRNALVLSMAAASIVLAAAVVPSLAGRDFDPGIVSAEKVTSIESTTDGAWALTSSGKILFCAVADKQDPKVVCFDRAGRTGMDY